jgi:hypothetical protein
MPASGGLCQPEGVYGPRADHITTVIGKAIATGIVGTIGALAGAGVIVLPLASIAAITFDEGRTSDGLGVSIAAVVVIVLGLITAAVASAFVARRVGLSVLGAVTLALLLLGSGTYLVATAPAPS